MLKNQLCSVLFFPMAMLIQSNLLAGELYKWKDEYGVTHFSEKKPENIKLVESIDIEKDKLFDNVKTEKPVKKPEGQETHHIVLVRPDSFWRLPNPEKKTTSYYFGGDCVSPSSVAFQDMRDNHPNFLPREGYIVDYINDQIQQLNYAVTSSMKKPLEKNLARYLRPVVLRIALKDFILHACVTNLRRQYSRNRKTQHGSEPFDYHVGDFNRKRAKITLHWQLEDAESKDILFGGTTSGSANFWGRDNHKYKLKVVKTAIKNATINLFSDTKFIKSLAADSVENTRPKMAIPKRKEEGFLAGIGAIFRSNAMRKSEFATVLSGISPLKAMTVEYYLSEGKWPTELSDIGLTKLEMLDDEYISNIQFDFDGAIVVELEPSIFDDNAVVSFQPKLRMGGSRIDWKCLTNLDESYYDNYCSRVE